MNDVSIIYTKGGSSFTSRNAQKHVSRPVKRIEFLPLKTSDDEETGEEIELLSRGKLKRRTSPTVPGLGSNLSGINDAAYSAFSVPATSAATSKKFFIEHKLQPDDTVKSLSLRYNCCVVDLKRLNGLTADQDLFALKTVKIPVSPFGRYAEDAIISTTDAEPHFSGLRFSPVPSKGSQSDTRAEQFFSKIDSSMQDSFFWLAAKKPMSPGDDSSAGPPEIMVETSRSDGYMLLSDGSKAFTRASSAPKRKPSGDENNDCTKVAIALFISALVFALLLLPLVVYLFWKEDHDKSAAIHHNLTGSA